MGPTSEEYVHKNKGILEEIRPSLSVPKLASIYPEYQEL